jgi:hypothetical protein
MTNELPPGFKCVTCVHRILDMRCNACQTCIFYHDYPNYKEDVTITTTKLDYFTTERYPQYAENSDSPKSKA